MDNDQAYVLYGCTMQNRFDGRFEKIELKLAVDATPEQIEQATEQWRQMREAGMSALANAMAPAVQPVASDDSGHDTQTPAPAEITTLTIESARQVVLQFGKYKGRTLGELEREDPDYLDWLADNAREPFIRVAASKLSLPF